MNILGIGLAISMFLFGLYMIFKRTDHESLEIVQKNLLDIGEMRSELKEVGNKEEQDKLCKKMGLKIKGNLREIKNMEDGLKQSRAIQKLEGELSNISKLENKLEAEVLNNLKREAFRID